MTTMTIFRRMFRELEALRRGVLCVAIELERGAVSPAAAAANLRRLLDAAGKPTKRAKVAKPV